MVDYDFLILSPNEFEDISRDLLQKKLSVYIESFTSGRDGGIDLRYSTNKDKSVIIQAKRYKSFSGLLSSLKKEVDKVKKLSPSRYIITTSVGLSPNNKEIIQELFEPFIKSPADIIGRDDLNNLLGIHSDIEKQYYKLWLSSINVLEKFLHSKVFNQSEFELDEIKEQIKLYVQNDSLNEALDVLDKNKYLIISGIPGIGKTTLARVIVLYLLSNGFDEFIFLNQSIDDGYELFNDKKSQVFLFDDFLGSNFLGNSHPPNEDNKIVKFIEKIKKSHNKRIIFTTREYILKQAKSKFESFNINNIEIAKCVLDLSSYTNIIKAQILYNHLFFAQVPLPHITNIIKKKGYLKLVKHQNYNPRIIETIVKQKVWESCEPNQFMDVLISLFDNPESVWLHAYENNINQLAQTSLLVLLTTGTPILLTDWAKATKEFFRVNHINLISFDSIHFNKVIKQLENTFIRTQVDSDNQIAIEYQNPSIQDFLVNYLRGNDGLIENIINAIVFTEQFFTMFKVTPSKTYGTTHQILLTEDLVDVLNRNIIEKFDKLSSSNLTKLNYSDRIVWYQSPKLPCSYYFLNKVISEFSNKYIELNTLIYQHIQERIYIGNVSYSEKNAYLRLLSNVDLNKLSFDEERIFNDFIEQIHDSIDIRLLLDLKNTFPTTFKNSIKSSSFDNEIKTILTKEIDDISPSDSAELEYEISEIQSNLDINLSSEISILNEQTRLYDESISSESETHIDNLGKKTEESETLSEDEIIKDIFSSLLAR
jgi:DNA polymerase III delta prime subunit